GLLAPDAVKTADLNGDGISDLIVANGGSNEVLVYLGTGNGQFAPARKFPVGTNPVGLTVTYLDDTLVPPSAPGGIGPVPAEAKPFDPALDVVVTDEGSNDVTILLGEGQGADWTFKLGPRLQTGAGPVGTLVRDLTGPQGKPDGIPDIVVSNHDANSV